MASQIESLTNPATGTIATTAFFGKPVFDLAKGIVGASTPSGNPDCNGGNPQHPRTFQSGLIPYTNANGITSYPGTEPFYASDMASRHTYVVPAGEFLVVTGFTVSGAASTAVGVQVSDTITINGVNFAWVYAPSPGNIRDLGLGIYMSNPIVLASSWSISVPVTVSITGYYTIADPQITPVVRSINNGTSYTITNGKMFWFLGAMCSAVSGAQNAISNNCVECTGGYPLLFVQSFTNFTLNATNFGNVTTGSVACPSSIPVWGNGVNAIFTTNSNPCIFWGIEV